MSFKRETFSLSIHHSFLLRDAQVTQAVYPLNPTRAHKLINSFQLFLNQYLFREKERRRTPERYATRYKHETSPTRHSRPEHAARSRYLYVVSNFIRYLLINSKTYVHLVSSSLSNITLLFFVYLYISNLSKSSIYILKLILSQVTL